MVQFPQRTVPDVASLPCNKETNHVHPRTPSHLVEHRRQSRRQRTADGGPKRSPDFVALQEVRLNALANVLPRLDAMGLSHAIETVHQASDLGRTYGEVIASRWPLRQIPATDDRTPYPERVLAALLDTPCCELELLTAHIVPGSRQGIKEIEMFEGIYRRLAHHANTPRILCGDFNAPQAETREGRIIAWGEKTKSNGEIVITRDEGRWDAAERSILQGLAAFDMPDVFRKLNGYEVEAYSWFSTRKTQPTHRRFDHIFASEALNPIVCRYLTDLAEAGLSDHAPIEAIFRP
ncbi:MAG: endonuclease/exonuclease/phosphatase family protein [Anaerolineae bacterium]